MNNLVIKSWSVTILTLSIALFLSPIAYADGDQYVPDFSDPTISVNNTEPQSLQLNLTLDRTFSPIVGADLMIFALRGYQSLDDCLIPSTQGDRSATLMLGRFTKLLFETTLCSTLMVTQHEVFGHGARAREFHVPVFSYIIRPFSGCTTYSAAKYNELPLSEQIAITAGGMEGSTILAKRVRDRWLYADRIDSREALLYWLSSGDQTGYINDADKKSSKNRYISSGHDVWNYIHDLNVWYGKRGLTARKLRKQSLIDYLDPFLYYSLYSLGTYVFDGTQQFCDYPMIPIGDCRYLPGARLALAPYGPEYQWLNYLKTPEHLIQATFRYGNTSGQHSQGATVEITRIWASDLLCLDAKLCAWNQPKLFTPSAKPDNTTYGAAAFITARYQVIEKIEMLGQVGYKTTGFLQGEPLKHGPIARIGLVLHL